MFERGQMRGTKKIMGLVIGIIGIGFLFNIGQINTIVLENLKVTGILLLVISYFMVISGRQN